MHFNPSSKVLFRAPLLVFAVFVCLSAAAGTGRFASAASSGLAYDEVTKFIRADQGTPQPGTFTADFQAAVDASKSNANAPQHHGILGSLMNAANAAKNAMSIFTTGTASTHYYMNGWERTDDPGAQTATIDKPDKRQIIYLNLAKKTYRIVDMSSGPVMGTPPPYNPQNPQAPPPSPQPGTGKVDVTVSSTVLGPMTIENIPTTGYHQDFKIASTQSTGSCHDGSFETSMIEYISKYSEPHAGIHIKMTGKPTMPTKMPPTMGMMPGCQPTMSMHTSGTASAPSDRLSLWTLVTLSGAVQSQQGQAGGGFSTLTERGNVRTLGASDAGLFEVPSDFTKEQ